MKKIEVQKFTLDTSKLVPRRSHPAPAMSEDYFIAVCIIFSILLLIIGGR